MDRLEPGTGTPGTLAQWRAATAQDAHSVALAPGAWGALFVNLVGNDYHLSPTSAAINVGISGLGAASAPVVDRDGNPRPAGPSVDIGAYEFGSTTPCPGDFNSDGAATVQDIFDFLSAYFGQSSTADVNQSGGLSVQDVFDFLSAFFTEC